MRRRGGVSGEEAGASGGGTWRGCRGRQSSWRTGAQRFAEGSRRRSGGGTAAATGRGVSCSRGEGGGRELQRRRDLGGRWRKIGDWGGREAAVWSSAGGYGGGEDWRGRGWRSVEEEGAKSQGGRESEAAAKAAAFNTPGGRARSGGGCGGGGGGTYDAAAAAAASAVGLLL